MIIEISYNKINLSKCTIQGLNLLMEICLIQEEYIKAAKIRDELIKRNL